MTLTKGVAETSHTFYPLSFSLLFRLTHWDNADQGSPAAAAFVLPERRRHPISSWRIQSFR